MISNVKHLYVWNDMPLFLDNKKDIHINKFLDLAKKCAESNGADFHLINSVSYDKWCEMLTPMLNHSNVIQIGTRPSLLALPKSNVMKLATVRSIDSNGITKSVGIKDIKGFDEWLSIIGSELHIVEDVLITGNTISCIVETIRNRGYKGQIILDVFCANVQALKKIGSNMVNLTINSHIKLEGIPIKQSTLICCHDLIYGYLGDRHYYECAELLAKFFGDNVNDLIFGIKQIQSVLGGN